MNNQTRATNKIGESILELCQEVVASAAVELHQRIDEMNREIDRLKDADIRVRQLEARFNEFDESMGKLRARVNRAYDDLSDDSMMEHKRLSDQYVALTREDVPEVVRLRNRREAPAIPDADRNAHRGRLAAEVVRLLVGAETSDPRAVIGWAEGGPVPARLDPREVERLTRLAADFRGLRDQIGRLPGDMRFSGAVDTFPIEHCEIWPGCDPRWPVTLTIAPAYLVGNRTVVAPWVLTEPEPLASVAESSASAAESSDETKPDDKQRRSLFNRRRDRNGPETA